MESDEILNHSYNTDTKLLRINSSREEGIETIDVSHQKIHEGLAYTFVCDKSSLDNGDSFWIMFKTNSVKNVHLRPAVLFTTDSLVVGKLYESPTFTGGFRSSEEEWILKSDTLYGIKVENIGSSSTDVTVIPFWYEVEY